MVSFRFLNPEDGTDELSQNVGKKLPLLTLLQFSGLWFVKYDSVYCVLQYYSFGKTCCLHLQGSIT
jgi:hypothetical protein